VKILLVDDTVTERMIMTALLKNLGYEIVSAENGQQALDLYNKEYFDLVLLDVVMPVMDGYETSRQIRAMSKTEYDWTPIILLSGRTEPNDIATGIKAGADDYLTKPVDLVILSAKMQAMQRIATMRQRLLEISAELEEANASLQRMANVDALTELTNRRQMDKYFERMLSHCARSKLPLSIIMLDIDYFKDYNDHYGHPAGDSCLKKIAKILERSITRPIDMAARYGGEEFIVILPETPLEGAQHLAESIRSGIEKLSIPHAKSLDYGKVTVSLGVAGALPSDKADMQNVIKEADLALYQAKQNGRNRVFP
jgi:diguanylate cyclase (GGDEF)-like protein